MKQIGHNTVIGRNYYALSKGTNPNRKIATSALRVFLYCV